MVCGPSWLSSVSAICPSCAWPVVRPSLIGSPCASTTAWILVVSPPRDLRLRPPFLPSQPVGGHEPKCCRSSGCRVVCSGDGVHHPIPYTRLPPPHEAVVAGSARAKPLWQITPRRAGSQHPKNAVQHAAIIDARHSARFVGQKRRDHAPFEVGQVISAHAYAESDFACHANPIYGFTALISWTTFAIWSAIEGRYQAPSC